jgi:hypothetical protein
VYGKGSRDALGQSVLGLGDINRDGWPDVAIGAYGRERALIYFGGPGILDGVEDVVLKGGGAMVFGDFNGDGVRDLIVNLDNHYAHPIGPSDTVFVYFGTKTGPLAIDTVPGLLIFPPAIRGASAPFADQMFMGDLNCDGFDDLVLTSGAVLDTTLHSSGAIHVYLGRPQPRADADFTVGSRIPRAAYAETLHMGDVTGDGVPDLVVTTYALGDVPDSFDDDSVLVDIFHGGPGWTLDTGHPDRHMRDTQFHGPVIGYVRLLDLIDANADGRMDVCISNHDSVYIYFATDDGFRPDPGRILPKPAAVYDCFLSGTCEIGDITADGYPDYTVHLSYGTTGFITVYPGDEHGIGYDRAAVAYLYGTSSLGWPGSCTPVGDINGDGVNDFAAGAPFTGFGYQDGYFAVYSGDTTLHPTAVEGPAVSPAVFSLSPAYPNPSTSTTTLLCEIPRAGSIAIDVRDLLGRHRRTLVDGLASSGPMQVVWDGSDDAGVPVPPGIYVVTLQTPDARLSRIAVRLAR